jgi:hypothetical protein
MNGFLTNNFSCNICVCSLDRVSEIRILFLKTVKVGFSNIAGVCRFVWNFRLEQASTLTYFSTCPFGQLTKKSTCPTQSFSCLKKLIKITKTREYLSRAPTTFKLEGEVISLSESSQGEVGDNREKWGDFWAKSIAINRNIVSRPL